MKINKKLKVVILVVLSLLLISFVAGFFVSLGTSRKESNVKTDKIYLHQFDVTLSNEQTSGWGEVNVYFEVLSSSSKPFHNFGEVESNGYLLSAMGIRDNNVWNIYNVRDNYLCAYATYSYNNNVGVYPHYCDVSGVQISDSVSRFSK